MARAIFQTIYDNVKQSIDDGTYAYQSYLPSETELTQLFDCSRMTVRRAISMLAADGYVLPQQGKGMRVIRNISDEKSRGGGGLETFKEIATSRGFELKTVTTVFELLVCSKALSRRLRAYARQTHSLCRRTCRVLRRLLLPKLTGTGTDTRDCQRFDLSLPRRRPWH